MPGNASARRPPAAALALLLALSAAAQAPSAAAQGPAEAGEAAAGPVVVRNINYDLTPNVQTFAAVPGRVVSVNGSATEILLALGVGDRIVGIAYQDNPVLPEYREAFRRLRALSARYPGRETVLSLAPDLIVGWHSAFSPQNLGDARYWNDRGVATYILEDSSPLPYSLETVLRDIETLGAVFRKDAEARAIAGRIRSEIALARARRAGTAPMPRALLLEPYPGGRLRSWGPDSVPGRMLEALGAVNAYSSTGERGMESIIASDADAAVFVYMDSTRPESERLMESFRTDPALRLLRASREGRLGLMPLSECY
ncbi:MAG: ABC transporter substrate-binding protein, partial [Deltaproteobacteria bacterium]|nr:ABC transporter substrate-binding protein [Deltaproteobacteria bacterium]